MTRREPDGYVVLTSIPVQFDERRPHGLLARVRERWTDWRERRAMRRGEQTFEMSARLKALRYR